MSLIIFCLTCRHGVWWNDVSCSSFQSQDQPRLIQGWISSSSEWGIYFLLVFLLTLRSPRWVSLVSHRTPNLGIPWKISLQFFHRKLLSKLLLLIIIIIFCYSFTCYTWTVNLVPIWCKLSPHLLAEQSSCREEQSNHVKLAASQLQRHRWNKIQLYATIMDQEYLRGTGITFPAFTRSF